MTRDPLLPVRLVDGVWISAEPAVASPIVDDPFTPTLPSTGRNFRCFPDPSVFTDVVLPPRPATDYARAFAEYNPPPRSEAEIAVTMDADEARKVAEHVLAQGQRTIFAVLHPCGYLYALGDTEADARENALSRRDINRDEARSVGVDFPPPETDAAWADELIFVTVSGTAESLRVYVAAVDDVIPWCPADLWDSGEAAP